MFEAFGRNKYTSTGVIQWMLNNAWPSMIWHLYDYYLRPGGGYFGAKKACEPLHVQYLVRRPLGRGGELLLPGLSAHAGEGPRAEPRPEGDVRARRRRWTLAKTARPACSRCPSPPDCPRRTSSNSGSPTSPARPVSRNFYWLSTKPETPDWDRSTWYYTRRNPSPDLTGLAALPPARLSVAAASPPSEPGERGTARVRVENPVARWRSAST